MPEAEASLERLYFQTILPNRSYDFLYRCEPSIDTMMKVMAFLFFI